MKSFFLLIISILSIRILFAGPTDYPVTFESGQAATTIVDTAGNLYWFGYNDKSGLEIPLRIKKFDEQGTLLWEKLQPQDEQYGSARDLEVILDRNENVIVLSKLTGGGGFKNGIVLTKLNGDGAVIWQLSSLNNGEGVAGAGQRSVAVDASNNMYVLMRSAHNAEKADVIVEKYDENAKRIWRTVFDSLGGDFPEDLEVTSRGTILANVTTVTPFRTQVVQFSDEGKILDTNLQFPPGLLLGDYFIRKMVSNATGDCYFLGETGARSPFIAKFDDVMRFHWFRDEKIDQKFGVASGLPFLIDPDQNLVIAYETPIFSEDILIKTINRDGEEIRRKSFDVWSVTHNANNDVVGFNVAFVDGELNLFTRLKYAKEPKRGFWHTRFPASGAAIHKEIAQVLNSEVPGGIASGFEVGRGGHIYADLNWSLGGDFQPKFKSIIYRLK